MKLADFRLTHRNVIQFLEYMVGGGVYFWTAYGTFASLYTGLGWNWFPAKIISDIIGLSLSYVIQRYWAFNSRRLVGHDAEVVKRFGLVSIVSLMLDYLIIWTLNLAGVSPYIGFFVAAGFFTAWNYLWYRFWVFSGQKRNVSKEVV